MHRGGVEDNVNAGEARKKALGRCRGRGEKRLQKFRGWGDIKRPKSRGSDL
jgi:hypothetical protein